MPGYRDKEVIETYAKGAPARDMDLMSPIERKGEVYAQRRRTSRDQYLAPRRRSPVYYDDDDYDDYDNRHATRTRRLDVSQRHDRHRRDDRIVRRHHYSSSSSSSDSDSDTSPHRRRPKLRPCGSVCRDNPPNLKDDPDAEKPYDSTEELKERAKRRKNTLLTAGLASVATVAAGNNIYQNTKAYHARKNAMKDGDMCSHEFEKLKTKSNLMNLFSLGVVAVGLNNVRMGWMRHENTKAVGKEADRKAWERKVRRKEERYGRDDRDSRDDRYQ